MKTGKAKTGLVALALAAGIGCNSLDDSKITGSVGSNAHVQIPSECGELVSVGFDVRYGPNFYDVVVCKDNEGQLTLYVKEFSDSNWTARKFRRQK